MQPSERLRADNRRRTVRRSSRSKDRRQERGGIDVIRWDGDRPPEPPLRRRGEPEAVTTGHPPVPVEPRTRRSSARRFERLYERDSRSEGIRPRRRGPAGDRRDEEAANLNLAFLDPATSRSPPRAYSRLHGQARCSLGPARLRLAARDRPRFVRHRRRVDRAASRGERSCCTSTPEHLRGAVVPGRVLRARVNSRREHGRPVGHAHATARETYDGYRAPSSSNAWRAKEGRVEVRFRVACVQSPRRRELRAEISAARDLVRRARDGRCRFITTTEVVGCSSDRSMHARRRGEEADHPLPCRLSRLARETGAWILMALAVAATMMNDRLANAHFLLIQRDDRGALRQVQSRCRPTRGERLPANGRSTARRNRRMEQLPGASSAGASARFAFNDRFTGPLPGRAIFLTIRGLSVPTGREHFGHC